MAVIEGWLKVDVYKAKEDGRGDTRRRRRGKRKIVVEDKVKKKGRKR